METFDEAVKTVLDEGLGEIPIVGGFIRTLVDILWPDGSPDVWDQIRDRVEQAIDEKFDENTVKSQTDALKGLQTVITSYQQAATDDPGDTETVLGNFITARGAFELKYPSFADDENAVLLLPLFGPFIDLYLALLRDGALFGASWGWNEKLVNDAVEQLDTEREKAINWVDTKFAQGLAAYDPPRDLKHGEPGRTAYLRTMTRGATDHRHFWPYFVASRDVQRPGPIANEVYANLIGEVSAADPQRLVHVTHEDRLTGLHLGCHSYRSVRVDAIAVDYGGVFGPEEGDTSLSVTTEAPLGWSGQITPDNPLIGINGDADSTTLIFKNSTIKIERPLAYEAGTYAAGPYDGQVVSSVTLTGVSGFGGVGGVSVGFRYEDSYPPLPEPILIDWTPWSAAPAIDGVTPQSFEHAKAAADQMGGRLASRDELYVAWWKFSYEEFAFGMLDDASFAVPLQADRPDWRRGPNLGATGGNQGFFMVAKTA